MSLGSRQVQFGAGTAPARAEFCVPSSQSELTRFQKHPQAQQRLQASHTAAQRRGTRPALLEQVVYSGLTRA